MTKKLAEFLKENNLKLMVEYSTDNGTGGPMWLASIDSTKWAIGCEYCCSLPETDDVFLVLGSTAKESVDILLEHIQGKSLTIYVEREFPNIRDIAEHIAVPDELTDFIV